MQGELRVFLLERESISHISKELLFSAPRPGRTQRSYKCLKQRDKGRFC